MDQQEYRRTTGLTVQSARSSGSPLIGMLEEANCNYTYLQNVIVDGYFSNQIRRGCRWRRKELTRSEDLTKNY